MVKFGELYLKGRQTILGFACLLFFYQIIFFIFMLRDYIIKFVSPSNLQITTIVLILLVPIIGYFDFKKNDFIVHSEKGGKIFGHKALQIAVMLIVFLLFGLKFYAQKNNIIWPFFTSIFLVDGFLLWFLFYTARLGRKA